jgi:hypothetical protein
MNDKKNIDRLFQERFKDFEAEPKQHVWSNIQTALKENKKERKIIPFWIQISSVAAAFFMGILALNTISTPNLKVENGIVFDTKPTQTNDGGTSYPSEIKNNQKLVESTPNNQKTPTKHEEEITSLIPTKTIHEKKNKNNARLHFAKNHTPLNQATASTTIKANSFLTSKNTEELPNSKENHERKDDEKINLKHNTENSIVSNSPENAPTEQPIIVAESSNELEELLKIKEAKTEKLAYNTKNKWQISPNIAPVYMNSNSSGSSIDPQFSENKKTAQNSLSVGIGVNYAVSKKIALRTGINSFVMGYNTNNVVYYAGLNNNNLANITYNTPQNAIEVQSKPDFSSQLSFEKDIQKSNTGAINQKMGYYEVPLEISYTLLDKKFGISVIGGLSTLFLQENKISLVSSETNVHLGEANNLNSVHFSSNFGLGFRYQFMKSFQINFEPTIKYQMNTFSNDVGNFKPYFVGLYSGISYRF